jgi:Tol biopolymer transport system component
MAEPSRYVMTMSRDFPKLALRPRLRRACLAIGAALFAVVLGAAQASALPATYDGIAADGHLALFSTAEQMVPGDTDHEQDVYVRAKDAVLGEWVTREVSIGPLGGNDAYPAQYDGVSSDGSKVFFSTKEPLVTADGDRREDVYMRDLNTNTTTLVTQGDSSCAVEGCGSGAADSSFVPGGIVASGERLFFATTEKLNAADGDNSLDIYMRNLASGKTVLVSQGDSSCAGSNCGNGIQPAIFEQASTDGEKVFFTSTEGLVAGDKDGRVDIYERDLGSETTKLVSVAGACPPSLPAGQNCDPTFGGASSDGSHAFFESDERISEADEDSSQDVYDWSGSGPAALASTGPSGGNGTPNATYSGTSGKTGAVYFETTEALDPAVDKDTEQDVYVRAEGTTKLVSTGPESRNGPAPASFQWASPDGSSPAAIFSTTEALVPQDTDTSADVYERSGGTTTLISTGPEGGNGAFSSAFAQASSDGSHVFFVTAESLVEEDEDESADLYLRSGGETALVSAGPIGGNGSFSAGLHGVSGDGSQAFFVTRERLTVDDDFANEDDVYSWTAGKTGPSTLLVSVKNSSELVLGPPPPFLEGTNPASPAESTTPSIVGQAEAGATITIYTNSSCSGEAVPPGGDAEELSGAGIPVSVTPGSKTTFYATAELEGIVSPCSNGVAYVQETASPPPPPPPPPKEEGGSGGGSGSGGGIDGLGNGNRNGQSGPTFVTPETTITFGPAFKTRKHKVVFRFSDATGQSGTNFVCKIDRHHWKGCGSPKRLKRLSFGKHVFAVKAVNQVGVWDAPVKRAFKVVR